jgi:demethoxyubiquinone hydroxylase (CLK1/Coq7/Cat5 family)
VLALAALHGHAEGIIPTLYLHLAHWPALLTPLYGALSPLFAMGRIAALRGAALAAASIEAEAIRPHLARPPLPPADALAQARAALEPFTGQVIPDMVPIGLMLSR